MENGKIKVLAYCDSPTCATGFATVSRNILMGLQETGRYEITILGINYWGTPHPFKDFSIYPTGINQDNDPYGRKYVANMLQKVEHDILFTLQDSFILEFLEQVIPEFRRLHPNVRWINYFPVDGVPKKKWISVMSMADYNYTYTEWGKKLCEEVYPPCKGKVSAIPHGVNIKNFFPAPKDEVERFKTSYFGAFADKFIVTTVNRNQQRKDIPRSMLAFKRFKEQRPNSVLYLHMAPSDHGWDLIQVVESLGLKVNEDVFFPGGFSPNGGYPIDVLNLIYNASDCIVSTTLGEGALHENTLVYTGRGLVPIHTISAEDVVLTHKGRYCQVGKTLRVTPEAGSVYKLRLFKFNEPFYLTKEHPVLTKRGFVRADELVKSDIVLFAKQPVIEKDVDSIDMASFCNEQFVVGESWVDSKKAGYRFSRYLPLNEEVLWLMGLYLAEGSIGAGSVSFSLHQMELDFHAKVASVFNKYLNTFGDYTTPHFVASKKDKSGAIRCSNKPLCVLFETLFGTNCRTKNIPAFIRALPPYKLQALVAGMLDGDGDSNPARRSWQEFRYKTVSPLLAYGLRDVLLRLGCVASVRVADNSRGFGEGTIYEVVKARVGKYLWDNATSYTPKYTDTDLYVELAVLSVERVVLEGDFYDLQVPGDNSYTTAQCTVHNCGLSQLEAMACCKPVIFPDNTACSEIVGKDRGILVRSGWDDSAFTVLPHDNEVLRPLAHVGDMVDALIKLHDDPILRRTLGINGYKWVTSNLRWDKHVVPRWVDVFDKAAEESRRGPRSPDVSVVEV